MKRILSFWITVILVATLVAPSAFASNSRFYDSGATDSGNIEISTTGGKSIELVGHIEPTIISVVMPSYIPFDISKSVEGENKVLSPKIQVTNYSTVPVTITVDYASVDISDLEGVSWSSSKSVGDKQIAIGFAESFTHPKDLSGASWLSRGKQNTHLLDIKAKDAGDLFIVGAIGDLVPESKAFTIVPTLVVRQS